MNDANRKNAYSWRMGAVLLGALAVASPALADDPGSKFKMMDANGDGMISASEHAAAVTKMFGEMDTNGDGNVTAAEMDARHDMHDMKKSAKAKGPMTSNDAAMDRHEMSSAEKIAKMDTNGDGMLSAAEHDAGAKAMFSEMDADGNGSLSRQEMMAGHAAMKKDDRKTP